MKKFIFHILLFFAIVSVVDYTAGKIFSRLQSRAGGRTGAEWYVCNEMKDDIVIMGSSRASHHYVPQIITDSIGLSCYNAGQDGNGIILQYGRWKMISKRYTPKVVIYDVNPSFDLCLNDNMAYVDRLKPFCDKSDVRGYIADIFPKEKLKLFSQMYRYNYKFIEMVADCSKSSGDNLNGYIPLNGEIRKEMVDRDRPSKTTLIDEDQVKVYYLRQLAKECNAIGTQLVFVASPAFRGGSYTATCFSAIERIAKEYDLKFLYYYESNYSETPGFFKDSQHLNNDGAVEFSTEIVKQVQL